MKEFVLIAKAKKDAVAFIDAQDREAFMKRFRDWEADLTKKNKFVRSSELSKKYARIERDGNTLSLTDGPFVETKEAITGLFVIKAESLSDAVEISKQCPILRFDHFEIYEVKGDQS